MYYPTTIKDTKQLAQTLLKKEYAQFSTKQDFPEGLNPSFLTDRLLQKDKLLLRSYQKFIQAWLSPNTPNKRVLAEWQTGVGKSLGSIAVALEFIKLYNDYYPSTKEIQPSIFIIGFSKFIFQRELLKRPEFGFITEEEISRLMELRIIAQNGTRQNKDDYVQFESLIKKRLQKRNRNGYFKFLGYKEFYNKLFIGAPETLTEESLLQGLEAGKVHLNIELVKQFANSLMICDEIHNVYNSIEMNSYGLALRTILNIYEVPALYKKYLGLTAAAVERTTLRVIFMSATPINNSPAEIVDLLNLLIPSTRIKEVTQKYSIARDDLFDGKNLKIEAASTMRKLIRGYVSFIEDRDPKHYPARVFMGVELPIPRQLWSERTRGFRGKTIPYIKFIRCTMTKLHAKTYKKFYDGKIPLDGTALNDIVFPDPNSEYGLFRTKDIKSALKNAPKKWKDEHQIDIIKQKLPNNTETWVVTGRCLELENLKLLSSKYAYLVRSLIQNLKNDGGKFIISHQLVKIIGIIGIQEILRWNGFLDETSMPTENTRCSKCSIILKDHKKLSHDFIPVRCITVYGDLDKIMIDKYEEKFRDVNNIDGYQYRGLIGAKIINEGKDYSEIQEIYVITMPGNIPTLLQILGRSIRRGSSKRLPPEKRYVKTHILVSSFGERSPNEELTFEEQKYFEKMMDYLTIQEINKIFHEEAIDTILNKAILQKSTTKQPKLELLPFEIPKSVFDRSIGLRDIDTTTFSAFYMDDEIMTITYIIKRLFIEQQSVWTIKDLWGSVRDPPFDVQVNTELFTEDNFKIALHFLITTNESGDINVFDDIFKQHEQISDLFNFDEKFIQMGDVTCCITQVGKFIMMVPFINGVPFVDYESWFRYSDIRPTITISLTRDIRVSTIPYNKLKEKFYEQYSQEPIEKISTSVEKYDLRFHHQLLQESVQYVFNILTNSAAIFSEIHDFYFKMLYFYDKLDLVIFCDHLPEQLALEYSKYITHEPITYGDDKILKEKNKYNAFLISSIVKSSEPITFDIKRMNEFLGKTRAIATKGSKIIKTFSNLLPIGHFMAAPGENNVGNIVPHLYHPETGWKKEIRFSEFVKTQDAEIENNIVIGYFELGGELSFKFKIREPIHHSTKFKDLRKNKRGSVCSTTKKSILTKIARQLGIKLTGTNIKNICDLIKIELMKRELNARRKHRKGEQRIRWFYYHFE
jgi:hypothetical protein